MPENNELTERNTSLLQIFTWWLLIQLLGLAALPLAYRLFRWLPGRGYTFAKPLGLLLTSYILWLGASLGYLRNTSGGAVVAIAATAGLSLAAHLWWTEERDPGLTTFIRDHWRFILAVEILFLAAFLAWAGVRAYAPDKIMSSGGEKFMEIAFLNAILQSPTFPPHDPWLSGFAISYYYFGYVMMALLTRLSGVFPGVGFELYNALVFALTLSGGLGVVNDLVAAALGTGPSDRQALRFGFLGSLFVGLLANLEGLLEVFYARGLLPDAFWHWIDIPDLVRAGRITGSWYPGHGWWWWRASRVIRDRDLLGEPMPLSPIDEFPFFSFLLGDNHPHVMTLPFVLLAIALAFNLLRRQLQVRPGDPCRRSNWWNPSACGMGGDWALFGFYAFGLGALGFLNTWDYPIYVTLALLGYAAGRYASSDVGLLQLLQRVALLGLGLIAAGILLYLPFYVSFSSQAGGLVPYLLAPTRLLQYLVMFGPLVFVAAAFLINRFLSLRQGNNPWRSIVVAWALVALGSMALLGAASLVAVTLAPGEGIVRDLLSNPHIQRLVGSAEPEAVLRAIVAARLRDPWLFLTLSFLIATAALSIIELRRDRPRDADPGAQFCSLLLICGLGLTFIVEFVYLQDSFGVRMNTVFKFYYQGWVMLATAGAFGVWSIMHGPNRPRSDTLRTAFPIMTALLVGAGLVYPVLATVSRVDGFRHRPILNGSSNVARDHPDDWAAIQWLRNEAHGAPVILEAPGRSYNYEGRISAFTGYPAVLGWALHESQWRGSYVEQGKREPDIASIYTSDDDQERLDLLRRWGVDLVIAGRPERSYVEELCAASERSCSSAQALEAFDRLLQPVFKHGQTTVYRVPNEQS